MIHFLKKKIRTLLELFLFSSVYFLIRILEKTYYLKVEGLENRKKALTMHPKGSMITTSWHEYVLVHAFCEKNQNHGALASRSFAGRLSGFILERLGFNPVYGSQKKGEADKGGKEARDAAIKLLENGTTFCLLPDATKGPRRVPKPGATYLSKISQAPILPVTVECDRFWRLNTWDKFLIPKPFAHITAHYEKPFVVSKDAAEESFEMYQQMLKSALDSTQIIPQSIPQKVQAHYQ